MTKNYLPIDQPGQTRCRAKFVDINYPADGVPSLNIQTENQVLLADGTSLYVPSEIVHVFVDDELLASEIPQIDITTGQVTGTQLGRHLYDSFVSFIVWCMQRHDALQDAPQEEPPEEEPDE